MLYPPDPRRPRQKFPPETERQIRIENTALFVATIVFWVAMGAVFGRMMRWW